MQTELLSILLGLKFPFVKELTRFYDFDYEFKLLSLRFNCLPVLYFKCVSYTDPGTVTKEN